MSHYFGGGGGGGGHQGIYQNLLCWVDILLCTTLRDLSYTLLNQGV